MMFWPDDLTLAIARFERTGGAEDWQAAIALARNARPYSEAWARARGRRVLPHQHLANALREAVLSGSEDCPRTRQAAIQLSHVLADRNRGAPTPYYVGAGE